MVVGLGRVERRSTSTSSTSVLLVGESKDDVCRSASLIVSSEFGEVVRSGERPTLGERSGRHGLLGGSGWKGVHGERSGELAMRASRGEDESR